MQPLIFTSYYGKLAQQFQIIFTFIFFMFGSIPIFTVVKCTITSVQWRYCVLYFGLNRAYINNVVHTLRVNMIERANLNLGKRVTIMRRLTTKGSLKLIEFQQTFDYEGHYVLG